MEWNTVAGEEIISAEAINKLGANSHCSIKKSNSPKKNVDKKKGYRCGLPFKPNRIKECKGINSKYLNFSKVAHFAKVCCQQKIVKVIEDKSIDGTVIDGKGSQNETYQLNIWKIKLSQNALKFDIPSKYDCMKPLFINNRVVKISTHASAKVLVCGMTQVRSFHKPNKLKPSTAKINPCNSIPIKVGRSALCSFTLIN